MGTVRAFAPLLLLALPLLLSLPAPVEAQEGGGERLALTALDRTLGTTLETWGITVDQVGR